MCTYCILLFVLIIKNTPYFQLTRVGPFSVGCRRIEQQRRLQLPSTMSSNHLLQGSITGPRANQSDKRIAKTQELTRSTGKDGKHYAYVPVEDHGKFRVLDEEGLRVEERRTSELKRSIQASSGGSKYAADGLAKSITVGSSSHAVKVSMQARHTQHHLDSASGAESKIVEAVRNGDVGILASDAKTSSRGSPSARSDRKDRDSGHKSSPASPKVKITTKTMTLSPQSKAYEKNLSLISAEMKASEGMDRSVAEAKHTPRTGAAAATRVSTSEARNQHDDDAAAGAGPSLRPSSAPSPTRARSFLSKEEAVRLHLQKEEQARLEAEAFLEQERLRFHRASVHGKEFSAMLRRAEMCHEKNQAKLAAKQAAAEKAEREAKEERERKRRDHLSKELNPASAMSWREIQENQEIARREAVEKRKQEIAASSRAPAAASSSSADAEKKMRAAAKAAEYAAENSKSFKAVDPEKVAEKLAKQSAAWERKLEEEKERVRQRMVERSLSASGKPTKSPVAAMEDRAKSAAARREARQQARDAKLKAEADRLAEQERKKTEILFNTKIPEEGRKLTKSAEYRAKMVREALEKEIADKKREEEEAAKRAKQEREIARMLRHQINDSERDRREQMKGGYRELSEAELEMNRKEAKKEFKRKLRENQEKLNAALQNRPSLLQRHEQTIAAKTAASSALNKVARAVSAPSGSGSGGSGDGKKGGGSGEYDFDFFTEEENIKLAVSRGAAGGH
jgi:hypothetical protein